MLRVAVVRWLMAGLFVLSLLIAFAVGLGQRYLHSELDIPVSGKVIVQPGDNLIVVLGRLHRNGLIRFPSMLGYYARISGISGVQAGHYALDSGDTVLDLLAKMHRGDVIIHRLTFPEGWTFAQWLQKLNDSGYFPENPSGDRLLREAAVDVAHPEGWFFPDTYQFSEGQSAANILHRAHRRMQRELQAAWQQRDDGLPYSNPYEVLIMASLIERETGVEGERKQIAGVFVRRLQCGMRLQTDPTVIYGLGEDYRGNITRRHLRQQTPYNTYRIDGLPPTPIAMPGRAALLAAVHPAPGDSLYFVAKGDGSHQFSATLQQHQRAVKKYQIEQRADQYRSAPQ